MTNEKAREYFSNYSEGTLDAGLARAFEAKLKADAELRNEYEQFEATLKELESLRFEEIETPFDLNDRISAAVDKSIYDKKNTAQPSWTLWLRNLAFAGLATAAVFGAYLSLNSAGGSTAQAGTGLGGGNVSKPSVEQIEYSWTSGGVKMNYRPSAKHSVSIKGGSEGEQSFNVDGSGWINDLKNDQPGAAVFTVEVKGDVPANVVAVPGKLRSTTATGQGSLIELAKAIADKYGVPVVVKSTQVATDFAWNLSDPDAQKAAQATLLNQFMVDIHDGVLTISDN